MRTLRFEKDYHTRLLRGHRWAWRNEFDPAALAEVIPGETVRLESRAGEFLGVGLANPLSHVVVRLLTREDRPPDETLFRARLEEALAWRRRVRPDTGVCRLVFGESDGLPGLAVDRYGPVMVISQSVCGMEPWTPFLVDQLGWRLQPDTILLKNTNPLRKIEGLPLETEVARGEWGGPVEVEHDGIRILADCLEGRKTGLFLDHRENRRLLARLMAGGESVLDLFSYHGRWGLSLLRAGDGRAVCVDSDPRAEALATESAARNGWTGRFEFHVAEAARFLEDSQDVFDVVVLDPPAFAKKKRYLEDALKTYRRFNTLALRRVKPGGLFASSSCSSFVSGEMLLKVVRESALEAGRGLQWVAEGHQALDHPVLPAMPETHYLKCLFFRVIF